jgi:DNA polymerase-3 subunit epsilon
MLPCFVMLDLETTGGNATRDRITEIAAVRIENGVETARWSSLVNPQVRIPPFIQALTGISDAMVEAAPTFDEVATRLLKLLEGAVLVAHNVRFDHGFLLHELGRMDIALKVKTMCTVRLSRRLYPQHKGHGIDSLMQRHGLQTSARHRAMGDVDVVLEWLKVARTELGEAAVQAAAQDLLQGAASTPPLLETPLEDIPEGPGVYLFFGEGPLPLYVGKSISIRKRVVSHFQSAARVAKEMRILNEIRRVEWRETAGELGALLLEARLVKELQPVYNRQLRRQSSLVAWRLATDQASKPLIELVRLSEINAGHGGSLYGAYRSKRQATEALRAAAELHQLCPQALGLESGKGACFAHQIGRCKGLCAGKEQPALHLARLQMALSQQRLKTWPYPGPIGIREHHAATQRSEVHVFDQWCHVATVRDLDELEEVSRSNPALAFDLDTYRLLLRRIGGVSGARAEIVALPAWKSTR